MADFERLFILSVPFHNVSFAETAAWATDRMARRQPGGIIVTPNLDFMYNVSRDRELRRLVYESDLVVADGMPAVWLSGLFGPRLKERVTGSDLTPHLLKVCADKGFSVFAIGGAPGVAEKALERVRAEHPGLKIAGTLSPPMGPFEKMDVRAIGERVREAAPQLVLIAMGMGKQERLMHWLRHNTDVPLMMGIGGSLDFLAGVQTRAPRWVGRIGLEWVWRMGTDPGRFIRRYFDDGVWLLSVLSRLLWVRMCLWPKRSKRLAAPACGPDRATIAELKEGDLLRLPKLTSGERQREFLEEAGRRPWRYLDLRAHAWLNSLELGVLAVLELRKASPPGASTSLRPDDSLCRQLQCLGLLEGAAGSGGFPLQPSRENAEARRVPVGLLVCAGLIGAGSVAWMAVQGRFSGIAQRVAFCGGCAILLLFAAALVWSAYVRNRRLLTGIAGVRTSLALADVEGDLLNDAGEGAQAGVAWRSWIKRGTMPGGDFIGCVFNNGRQVDFVLGDVSGKNEAAVLLGAASKYDVVRVVNEHVMACGPHEHPDVAGLARMIKTAVEQRFVKTGACVTIGYVRFDFDRAVAEYVWQGAPLFFHWSKASGQVRTVCGQGAVIGLQVRDSIQVETQAFAPGDVLVFCSDGVLSHRAAGAESLGARRVAEVIGRDARSGDAQTVLSGVQSLCEHWAGGMPAQDDQACLVTCIQELE